MLFRSLFLLVYHHEYKNKWVLIAHHLPHRNSSKLKNNFSSLIRKFARKISLNETETITSGSEFIQALYTSMIIYELTAIKNSSNEVIDIAPVHIYEHVKSKRLTCAHCMNYMKKLINSFVSKYKDNKDLGELEKINTIDDMKSFIEKSIVEIKKRYSPSSTLSDPNIISIIESQISNNKTKQTVTTSNIAPFLPGHSIGPIMKNTPAISTAPAGSTAPVFSMIPATSTAPAPSSVPGISIVNSPPIQISSPNNDMPFITYQHHIKNLEADVPQISELGNNVVPGLPMSYQPSPGLSFPVPTFASPAFQASLRSPQSQLISPSSNQLFSPNYYGSMMPPNGFPMISTPDPGYLQIPQGHYSIESHPIQSQSRASDFSMFTNKYVQ